MKRMKWPFADLSSILRRYIAASERLRRFKRQLFFQRLACARTLLDPNRYSVAFSLSQKIPLLLSNPRLRRLQRLLGGQQTVKLLPIFMHFGRTYSNFSTPDNTKNGQKLVKNWQVWKLSLISNFLATPRPKKQAPRGFSYQPQPLHQGRPRKKSKL